ncbi:Small cellulose binding protein [Phytophthora nicotianae]|uniref:Small cellulose binding protein n=1 Tax=Phytophthora nicotianae TaxID=4792 RepID=A0A0W8DS01_PHYNI|nr:Small cellulose binding protein [Phytophthora nicotianae]
MVKASDHSAAEVKRVNQQLEERHYEFRSNCNDGNGDASACHSWANMYELNCSKNGYPASCFNLGRLKLAGKGAEQDDLEAFKLFGPNSPIKRDIQQAKTYLEKACDANFAPACHNLAVMYKKGDESIPKDQAKYEEYRAKTEQLIKQAGGMSSIKSA